MRIAMVLALLRERVEALPYDDGEAGDLRAELAVFEAQWRRRRRPPPISGTFERRP